MNASIAYHEFIAQPAQRAASKEMQSPASNDTEAVLPLDNLIDDNDMGYSKRHSACHCLTELIKSELCEDNRTLSTRQHVSLSTNRIVPHKWSRIADTALAVNIT